jgi:hypothetical protein
MSKVAELAYDIEQMYINGWGAHKISEILDCPIEIVQGWMNENGVADTPQDEEIFSPYYGA